ncbi:MAG: redoxin domain-containing protein [Fimbriimonas sp.]|nr:redoxin domain-containing protein [Fimbriimonas sp.]
MKQILKFSMLAFASPLILALTFGFAGFRSGQNKKDPNRAPELVGGPWINTKDGKPVTLESRRGKPTLVAFWTFACENCQHNFPAYSRLLSKYREKGVELISVHTPEMAIERKVDEVAKHVTEDQIDYPVLIDNDGSNWKKWHVNMWPSLYVIDRNGIVRYHWFGELNWQGAGGEKKIGEVLDKVLAEK